MKTRVQSVQLPNRQKCHIRSLTSLLDSERIPLPQQSLHLKMFASVDNVSQDLKTKIHHNRTASQQQFLRKVDSTSRSVKFGVLESLRKTWHPSKFEEQTKLRTAGKLRKTYQSQEYKRNHEYEITSKNNLFYKAKKPPSLLSLDLKHKEKHRVIKPNPLNLPKNDQSPRSDFVPQCQKKNHQFLRKGASINRQVVANIIKMKIGKNIEQLDSMVQNQEIVKMIRLYKGYGQNIMPPKHYKNNDKSNKKQELQESQNRPPLRNKNILERSIIGWRDKSQEGDEDAHMRIEAGVNI